MSTCISLKKCIYLVKHFINQFISTIKIHISLKIGSFDNAYVVKIIL